MKLLKYEGYTITISEEALLLKPFKALWDRDKSPEKDIAKQELGYIYFMEDTRSDYQTYIERDERSKQIMLGEGMPSNWKPDKLVESAMEFYSSFKSDGALLLEDLRYMVANLRKELREISLKTLDEKGKPIYSIDSYTKIVKDLNGLIKSIDDTEKTINREITQSEKVRGAAEKAMFEDD